ncbi:MAG: nitroreductase [Pseudomonadota bacterium]|nr:nitroreductase [Pseudomonadota bacterium]
MSADANDGSPATGRPHAPTRSRAATSTERFQVLSQLMAARSSCRGFESRAVPRPVIELILREAQRTASWCNAQPWQVTVVSGASVDSLREALLECAKTETAAPDLDWPREYRGVYQDRRRVCGWGLYEAVGVVKGDRAASARQADQNYAMFGAPHVAIVSTDEALGTYGAVDCGAFVSNFMLLAASLGVATVAQAALSAHPRVLRERLGISSERLILCGISFGYADESHPANRFRTERARPAEVVTWRE